jgi:hypothetical protein
MTFIKGKPRPPGSGRRAGTPNQSTVRARRLISEADDRAIVNKTLSEAKAGNFAAMSLYYRYLRPPPPRGATFTSTPFELRAPTTLEDASEELLRIAGVVAIGGLDHATGEFLVTTIRAFVETLTGVKTEKEIALVDALKPGSGS